jgi:F-type H+-transporting ATPase subunit a
MEHASKVLLPLRIGGLDLSITTPTIWMICATVLLLLFLLRVWWVFRQQYFVPTTYTQNIFEIAVEFIEKQIIEPTGIDGKEWTPFVLSIFLFILFNDLMGTIPGATPATGNINETAALAIMVFVLGTFLRFHKKGFIGFFKSLIPEGVKGPVSLVLFPIELISQLVKPFSLAIRLFANMSGGHLLLLSILGFTTVFGNIAVSFLSVGGAVVIMLFEIFVGFIQAYVFAFLSALFIGESVADAH